MMQHAPPTPAHPAPHGHQPRGHAGHAPVPAGREDEGAPTPARTSRPDLLDEIRWMACADGAALGTAAAVVAFVAWGGSSPLFSLAWIASGVALMLACAVADRQRWNETAAGPEVVDVIAPGAHAQAGMAHQPAAAQPAPAPAPHAPYGTLPGLHVGSPVAMPQGAPHPAPSREHRVAGHDGWSAPQPAHANAWHHPAQAHGEGQQPWNAHVPQADTIVT